MKISHERRYLTVRTNTFELPLINDVDSRTKEMMKGSSDLPVQSDRIVPAEPEVAH